jgi:hypothetical protein
MLESELAAAAAGGVTSLVCPPDTDPVLDEPGLVEMLKFRARKLSRCRLFPLGALTRELKGATLTEMAELTEAGCVGFSQADLPLPDSLVLMRALQYAATYGYTVWLRPQDATLGKGVAASGAMATRLGLSGVPVIAETIALHTILELVRATKARVHLCRLSSAAGVALVRAAKAEGLPVSADVSINSLHLTDVDIGFFNPDMRLVPPLRQGADLDYLAEEVPKALAHSLEGLERVTSIVRAMKEFSHPGPREVVPADLNRLVLNATTITVIMLSVVTTILAMTVIITVKRAPLARAPVSRSISLDNRTEPHMRAADHMMSMDGGDATST